MNGVIKRAVIVVAGLGVLAAPAVAANTGVSVIRGTVGDTATGRPAAAGLPTVLRGWAPGAERVAAKPEPKRDAPGWIATGGESMWLVERGGQVVGCWLQGSTQVGEIDVLCGRGAWR